MEPLIDMWLRTETEANPRDCSELLLSSVLARNTRFGSTAEGRLKVRSLLSFLTCYYIV